MERRKRNLNFLYFRRIKKKAIPSILNGSTNLGWKLEFVRVRVRIQAHNTIKIQLIFFRVQPTERLGWTRNLIGLHFVFQKMVGVLRKLAATEVRVILIGSYSGLLLRSSHPQSNTVLRNAAFRMISVLGDVSPHWLQALSVHKPSGERQCIRNPSFMNPSPVVNCARNYSDW